MEENSYTSTHSLGHTGPVTGSLYHFWGTIPVFQKTRSPTSAVKTKTQCKLALWEENILWEVRLGVKPDKLVMALVDTILQSLSAKASLIGEEGSASFSPFYTSLSALYGSLIL